MGTSWDFVIAPVYLGLVFFFVFLSRKKFKKKYPEVIKYFYPAFTVKIIFTILIIWFFDILIQGYDMVGYFRATSAVWDSFWMDFDVFKELMTQDALTFSEAAEQFFINQGVFYYAHSEKIMKLCRPAFFLMLLSCKSIYGIGFLVSYFGFMASWRTYLVFHELFPRPRLSLAIACLFIPSVLFWGSAPLMRDTFTMIGLGYAFYATHRLINGNHFKLPYIVLLAGGIFLMIQMKPYVAFAYIPTILLWWVLVKSSSTKKSFVVYLKRSFFLIGGLASILLILSIISVNTRYSVNNIFTYLQQSQNYHGFLNEASDALGYSFEYDKNLLGMLSVVPSALVVCLFRPYLWEVLSHVQLVPNAIEGTITLLVFLYIILRTGIRRCLKFILTNPHLIAFLFFSLSYLFLIGFATYNFGSLVRYKIPGLSFFYATLAILYVELRRRKKLKPKTNHTKVD